MRHYSCTKWRGLQRYIHINSVPHYRGRINARDSPGTFTAHTLVKSEKNVKYKKKNTRLSPSLPADATNHNAERLPI